MAPSFVMISLLKQMFFLFAIISTSCASQSFTYKDTTLAGSVIKTLQSVDWFQCFELCFSSPECISYNFCPASRDIGVCQLNSCGIDAEKQCGESKTLRYVKHCVFHQFKGQPSSERCLDSDPNERQDSMVTGNFTCTGSMMSMYADGYPAQLITRDGQSKPVVLLSCPSLIHPPISLQLPKHTAVVSIEVYQRNSDDDSPSPSVIGGFSDELVTNAQWKCAYDVSSADWRLPNFNDNAWVYATTIRLSGDDDAAVMRIAGIPYNAKWIKCAGSTKRSLCRIKRK